MREICATASEDRLSACTAGFICPDRYSPADQGDTMVLSSSFHTGLFFLRAGWQLKLLLQRLGSGSCHSVIDEIVDQGSSFGRVFRVSLHTVPKVWHVHMPGIFALLLNGCGQVIGHLLQYRAKLVDGILLPGRALFANA